MPHGITQCYLPPGRGDIPALTPAEAGTRFSDPGGMQGWVDLVVPKCCCKGGEGWAVTLKGKEYWNKFLWQKKWSGHDWTGPTAEYGPNRCCLSIVRVRSNPCRLFCDAYLNEREWILRSFNENSRHNVCSDAYKDQLLWVMKSSAKDLANMCNVSSKTSGIWRLQYSTQHICIE